MTADADCFAVALTKDLCPCCCKTSDGAIVMNTLLTPRLAQQVRELHGQPIEYKMCVDCQTIIDNGGVWLIEADPTKSTFNDNGTLDPGSAHRTGRIWAIKREAADRLFNMTPRPMMFIDPEAAAALGLTDEGDDDAATVPD
jgi:hypothetical protein